MTRCRRKEADRHRSNIVAVQKESPGRQGGKHINIIISSYLPASGEGGFNFTEIGDGVYDLARLFSPTSRLFLCLAAKHDRESCIRACVALL